MSQQENQIADQGAHWTANVFIYVGNTSGTFSANLYQYANGAGQIRKHYTSSSPTANVDVSIHTSNTEGLIVLSMNSVTTASISAGRYVYDIELRGGPVVAGYSDGSKENQTLRACEGVITITPQVTQWDW